MTAHEFLADLARRGITVEPGSRGKLRCSPRSSVDAATAKDLRHYKQEILAILSRRVPEGAEEPAPPRFIQLERDRASELGLIARWSYEFGYVSIYDPTTGEWHDLSTKEAPAWARREAAKRKELRKHQGIHRTLAASEMEEKWKEEQAAMWEHPAISDKGLVYEDYIED